MKKYTTGLLIFAVLFIVTGSNIVFKEPVAQAQTVEETKDPKDAMMEMTSPEATPDVMMKQKSDYILPYPGILQNHPLYFLKELRDKIIETLIVDPLRKSEFYLLQSDKWIAASESLVSQGETELGQQVLNQSAERMKMAVQQLKTIKDNGREIPSGTLDKVENSIEKHLEIVDKYSVEKKINPDEARQSYLSIQEEATKLRN